MLKDWPSQSSNTLRRAGAGISARTPVVVGYNHPYCGCGSEITSHHSFSLRLCRPFPGGFPFFSSHHNDEVVKLVQRCRRGSFLLTERQVSTVSPVALTIAFLSGSRRDGPGNCSGRATFQGDWDMMATYGNYKMGCSILKLTQVSDTTKVLNSHAPKILNPLGFIDPTESLQRFIAFPFQISGGTHTECPACCESDGLNLHCLHESNTQSSWPISDPLTENARFGL